jgi:hypothetical protein
MGIIQQGGNYDLGKPFKLSAWPGRVGRVQRRSAGGLYRPGVGLQLARAQVADVEVWGMSRRPDVDHYSGYCLDCGKYVETVSEDNSIGPVPYGLGQVYHTDIREVCPLCGGIVDEGPENDET